MRPSILDPLFARVTSLPGVGPKLAALFDRLLAEPGQRARVIDVLFHLPHGAVARALKGSIAEAPVGEPVTVTGVVTAHRPPPLGRSRAPYRVLLEDGTGDVSLVFFNLPRPRIEQMLPMGGRRYVSGTIELFDGHRQMVHPARIVDEAGFGSLRAVEPIYGATEGLASRAIARVAAAALERVPSLPEWQDLAFKRRHDFPAFADALRSIHRPECGLSSPPGRSGSPDLASRPPISATAETGGEGPGVGGVPEEALAVPAARPPSVGFADTSPTRGEEDVDRPRRRLAYDELLASQLALALVRASRRRQAGRAHRGDGRLVEAITRALPFPLTGAQRRALAEIGADLASEDRMLRLVQGDVGSGKTLVALLAMASVIEAGRQAVLMAPTEILARQHGERIAPLAEAAGIRTAVLTGRDRGVERRRRLEGLADGRIQLAIGTHALFQQGVEFHDLGLAVIDEQHRFGVHQRLALSAKGKGVDTLVMTATPIPRTLALTAFGDMDISVLDEKPPGRQPITTRVVSIERLEEIVGAIHRALAAGDRVYWVCPLVEESEALDVAAAEQRFETLSAEFGGAVGLVHGRLGSAEKDATMERFAEGELSILVSTTVIEVGVDVPEATVMVIEHAERFGLAQLHQLRGRVGRGARPSTCLLLYKGPLGPVAKARLELLRETEDGFRIAEEDLRLRGEGEVLGTRQSGLPGFRLARPERDADLLDAARDDARLILSRDAGLASERGQALRLLLYLFERDAAIRLLRAG